MLSIKNDFTYTRITVKHQTLIVNVLIFFMLELSYGGLSSGHQGVHILVRRRVLRRTPKMVAPAAYWISLRMPLHFLSVSSYLRARGQHQSSKKR